MSTIPEITPEQAQNWLNLNNSLLIDVREVEEYEEIHVEGAILLPLSQFSPMQIPMNPDKKLIFMCKIGGRSGRAVGAVLNTYPDKEAYNMTGGMIEWAQKGLPVIEA